MPAQNKTSLGLNQWLGNEYPKRIDFVEDNQIINDELEKRVKNTDLATDTEAGILTLNKVREVAPQPDLSPYIPFTKGYKDVTADNFVLRCDLQSLKSPHFIKIYDGNGEESGEIHLNGSRFRYRSKNRNNYGWNDLMDNHDMSVRDNKLDHLQNLNPNNRGIEDIFRAHIRDIRLAGLVQFTAYQHNAGLERAGYVVTGIAQTAGDIHLDVTQMRALQFYRNGQWLNVPFA